MQGLRVPQYYVMLGTGTALATSICTA